MNFVKRHSLMDWAVQSSRKEGPLFIKTSVAERLTVVGVDAGVRAVDGASHDVIFIGTTSGRILKLAYPKSGDANAVLVESIQVRNININAKFSTDCYHQLGVLVSFYERAAKHAPLVYGSS